MLKIRILSFAIALVTAAQLSYGEGADGQLPVVAEAQAVLHINDTHWLERELTQFAATAGINPTLAREAMAQALFHSRSLEGIDTSRPALLAWRSGQSPLVAIIPLTDRPKFMKDFGGKPGGAGPLIRVGERNGTTVYTQNTDEGLCEYRLLVQDNTAFLARTPEECKLLAAHPLRLPLNKPALQFHAQGAFFKQAEKLAKIRDSLPKVSSGALLQLTALEQALSGWQALTDQVNSLDWDASAGKDGAINLHCQMNVQGDSDLAQWIGKQKNNSSRLMPLVRDPSSFLSIYGQINWQGQLERLGLGLVQSLQQQLGPERWTAAVEEAWQQQWSIMDQQGPFACALDFIGGERAFDIEMKMVSEQPRAAELATFSETVNKAIAPEENAAFEAVTINELQGTRRSIAMAMLPGKQSAMDEVRLGTETHLFQVASTRNDSVELTAKLMRDVSANLPPEGVPGIVVMQISIAPFFRNSQNFEALSYPDADISVALKSNAESNLIIDAAIPLQPIANLVRDNVPRISGMDGEPAPTHDTSPSSKKK